MKKNHLKNFIFLYKRGFIEKVFMLFTKRSLFFYTISIIIIEGGLDKLNITSVSTNTYHKTY